MARSVRTSTGRDSDPVRRLDRSRRAGDSGRVGSHTARAIGRRPHRLAVGLLSVLAGLCVFVGSFAVWLDRQVLNTEGWVSTSSRILANRTVRSAVGAYIVREFFASAGVGGALGSGLAGQALDAVTGGAQQAANEAVAGLLAQPSAQRVWREANLVAHRRALAVLEGHGQAVSARGPAVVLDLRPLVRALAEQLASRAAGGGGQDALAGLLGLGTQVLGQRLLHEPIPADRGRIVILRSSELQTAQDGVKAVRRLAIVLPIAALGCILLAMLLARGWRWAALGRIGLCLLVAGGAVVAARGVLEWRVVESLISSSRDRAAGEAAWGISSRLLLAGGLGLIVLGAVSAVTSAVGARRESQQRPAFT